MDILAAAGAAAADAAAAVDANPNMAADMAMGLDVEVAPAPASALPVLPAPLATLPVALPAALQLEPPPNNANLALRQQIATMEQQHQARMREMLKELQQGGAAPPLLPSLQAPPPAGLEAWEPKLLAIVASLPSSATLGTLGRIIAAATGIGPGALTLSMMLTRSAVLQVHGAARKVRVATSVGNERMDVIEAMVTEMSMIAGPMSMMANGVTMAGATAALHELYGVVAPEGDVRPDVAAIVAEQARATRQAEKDEKEFSPSRITAYLALLAGKYGRRAPTRGQLICPAQLRLLHEELVVNKMVPCARALEIEKLILWGGDNGVTSAKSKKDEDPEGADPKDAVELRARFAAYVHSIGVVTAADADGEAIYGAALDLLTALERSVWLASLAQVRSALRAAIGKARRMRNESGVPPPISAAYDAAAEVVTTRNDDASDPDKATPTSQQQQAAAVAGVGTLTNAAVTKMIADAAAAAAKGGGREKEKARGRQVTDADGKKVGTFENQKGGNPKCPVHCAKSHPKEAWCYLNHSKK